MRRPIEHERAGLRTPRERLWDAVRALRTFTLWDVLHQAKPTVKRETARTYVQLLVRAGYVQPGEPVPVGAEQTYTLVKDAFDAPRLDKSGQAVTQGMALLAMWRAMKALKEFDYHDIARAASVGAVQVKPATAQSYINQLARASYLRTVRESKPGTPARYRLVRDTGAQAPAITRRKCVFDRNLGEFLLQESAQEVCDGLD